MFVLPTSKTHLLSVWKMQRSFTACQRSFRHVFALFFSVILDWVESSVTLCYIREYATKYNLLTGACFVTLHAAYTQCIVKFRVF